MGRANSILSDDGTVPAPGGLMGMDYAPQDSEPPAGQEYATLAGGCFWCLEAVFAEVEGVAEVVSGYTGGHVLDPGYAQVCEGDTGHAEAVRIAFDPKVVPYRDLLEVFFAIHDPTTRDRQGNDVGSQYRSAIYFHSPQQQAEARTVMDELAAEGVLAGPIVTELAPAGVFYRAEDYHQEYFRRNAHAPYCQVVVAPKLAKFREKFAARRKRR